MRWQFNSSEQKSYLLVKRFASSISLFRSFKSVSLNAGSRVSLRRETVSSRSR